MVRVIVVICLLVGASVAFLYDRVRPVANAPQGVADYGRAENWVCLPGRADSCATNLAATAIAADGTTRPVPVTRVADPAIDCFYVYPTVSLDRTANARLFLAPELQFVTRVQFARFSTVCRAYAPVYRQGTLKALAAGALGIGPRADLDLAYGDVRNAWQTYLAKYNEGRGVVLIGHSQGSRMLKRLVQELIEGKPEQKRLVSVMLLGNGVVVPDGRDTGGDLHTLPLCHSPSQTGCVVAYSSFRASAPPPPNSRYGRDPGEGLHVACTNPAALGGGKAVLDAYFPTREYLAQHKNAEPPAAIDTPFVTLPGLISGQCVRDDHGSYLSISLNAHSGDQRSGDIGGDVVIFGHLLRQWGLHVIDVNLALGDLVRLVQSQAAAYAQARP